MKPRSKSTAKPRVVIELFQRGAELKGRVVSMDEELRGKHLIAKANGWQLESWVGPEIAPIRKILFLRGRDLAEDNRPLDRRLESEFAADVAVIAIRALLDKVNGVKPKASKWVRVI